MKLRLWQAARLKRMSKEAFDNLPSGVCFFNNHVAAGGFQKQVQN